MQPGVVYRRGRFLVSTEVNPPWPWSPSPPAPESLRESLPSGSSSPTEFIPWLPPSSGLTPRPPDGQPSSSRQPDGPQNTDENPSAGEGEQNLAPPVTRTPPTADAPRLSRKGKQSPAHLAGKGEQNLAPPVTRAPPAEDSRRLTEKRKKSTKELAGKGVQEQHLSFVQPPQPEQQQQPPILQTPQPEQQLQPPILQNPQPQQQQQFLPFPSFVHHPLIFQTLQPQQQQFPSFPSFVQQFSPFCPLIFQSHPPMAFSFPTSQLQQQLPSLFQTPQPQQQQQPSIFQSTQPQQQPQPSIFQNPQSQQQQQQPSIFQTPQPQQQQQQLSIFQTSQPQPQQQNVQFQQQQQLETAPPPPPPMLFTEDGSPATHDTSFVDLHPDSQKLLLRIEESILENRVESERLDQCIRLYDPSVSSDSFELDDSRILQELGGITTAIERGKVSVQDLMKKVNDMMCHMEFASHSYMMLRPRFLRPNVPAASGTSSASQTVGAAGTSGQTNQLMTSSISPIFEFYSGIPTRPSTVGSASQTVGAAGTSGQSNQLMTSSISPIFEFYGGIPTRPSKFVRHAAARFENYMSDCCQWIEELEQLVLMDTDKTSSNSLEALPRVMSNIHDYFIHVAAKVENLHRYVESMKVAYLADQRHRGDGNDPFLEASGREPVTQEAAARRVHPTFHLPANSAQPATQAAGIFASSAASISSAPQLSSGTTAASSSGGFSIFSTTSASSSFLFPTPASAQSSSLFGSAGFAPQLTPFGTPSTFVFGSTQAPLGFGTNTAFFSSTPVVGSSPLFTSPSFGTGATAGSGASFGAASRKSSSPESCSTWH